MRAQRLANPICFCMSCTMAKSGVIRAGGAPSAGAANDKTGAAGAAGTSKGRSGSRADGTGLPPVHHIGLVVKDCEATLAKLGGALGFGPAFRFEGDFPEAVLANGETGLSLRGAFVWMNNTALELVEPVDNRSPHAAFLKEKGEGLHHLAYWVDSVRGEIDAMKKGGANPQMLVDGTGPGNDVPWCYLEGDMLGGTIIELIERNPGSEQVYAEIFRVIGGTPPF